jgi:hypothetical protein
MRQSEWPVILPNVAVAACERALQSPSIPQRCLCAVLEGAAKTMLADWRARSCPMPALPRSTVHGLVAFGFIRRHEACGYREDTGDASLDGFAPTAQHHVGAASA